MLRLKLCKKTIPFHLEIFSQNESCSSCGRAPQCHELLCREGGSKQENTVLKIFCELRNLRAKLATDLSIPVDAFNSFLQSTTRLKSLKQQSHLESIFETLQNISSIDRYESSERILRLLIFLDTFYYQLYYYTTQCSHDLLPSPHQYFPLYLYDLSVLNNTLQTYLSNNFSTESVVSQRWGQEYLSISLEEASQNPLLSLHFSRWIETIYLFTSKSLSLPFPSSLDSLRSLCQESSLGLPARPHASMRLPNDPLLPLLHKIWFDSVRVWACHLYSYATPTQAAIDKLLSFAPLIEVGAGTGYWAHLVQQRVVQRNRDGISVPSLSSVIQAFDRDPTSSAANGRSNSYHGRAPSWTNILSGGATDSILTAHRRLPSLRDGSEERSPPHLRGNQTQLTLFLCYPPPDCDMALQALKQYLSLDGQRVCYVGEYRGDTGTKSFEKLLETSFECEEEVSLPNWGDTCYSLTIWRRRSSNCQYLPSHPCHNCCVCGKRVNHIYRCRITYSVSFCSQICASSPQAVVVHKLELSLRCLLNQQSNQSSNLNSSSVDSIVDRSELIEKDQSRGTQESQMGPIETTKKRKKRQKLRKDPLPTERPVVPSQLEVEKNSIKNDSDSSEDEDILTQLKRLRGSEDLPSNRNSRPLIDSIDLSPQWYMTL